MICFSRRDLLTFIYFSGLALAQILRNNSIAFEIFERDEGPGSREQGWSLNLEWVLPPLTAALSHLPQPISTVAVNARLGGTVVFAIFDGETGMLLLGAGC